MAGIAKKLKALIGDQSVHSWAKDHDISGTTVHDWIKFDRRPAGASMKALVAATGKPKSWWYSTEDSPPDAIAPAPSDSYRAQPDDQANNLRVAERRVTPPPVPEINVTALGLILAGILEGMGSNINPGLAARKAVEYYQDAISQGLITTTGNGAGGAKAA